MQAALVGVKGGMQAEQDHETKVTLHLAEPCANPAVAAAVLAKKLGIAVSEAMDRLCAQGGPVSEPLMRHRADDIRVILSTLGVRLEPHPTARKEARFDLSLQAAVWADVDQLSERLQTIIGGTKIDHMIAFSQPAGRLLSDLPYDKANSLERRLRRLTGLQVHRADQRQATYDIFTTDRLASGDATRLADLRARMGLAGDALSGAVLSGLGRGLCDRILASLPDLPLMPVQRAFQRFDLYLTGHSGWLTKDLADFLAARTGQPRARYEVLSPDTPVRLDSALPYAHVRRFCSDYAAIGLYSRVYLRGLPKNSDNPTL